MIARLTSAASIGAGIFCVLYANALIQDGRFIAALLPCVVAAWVALALLSATIASAIESIAVVEAEEDTDV